MAQATDRAGDAGQQRRVQARATKEAIVVMTSNLCQVVDRYLATLRLVLARCPEYGEVTCRAGIGARLDQLEASLRDATAKADAAGRS